jgi:hypothetical protein
MQPGAAWLMVCLMCSTLRAAPPGRLRTGVETPGNRVETLGTREETFGPEVKTLKPNRRFGSYDKRMFTPNQLRASLRRKGISKKYIRSAFALAPALSKKNPAKFQKLAMLLTMLMRPPAIVASRIIIVHGKKLTPISLFDFHMASLAM